MSFIPSSYTVSKDRKRGIIVSGDPINWNNLSESELKLQWISCMNAVWFAEKEGIISRKELESIFFDYLKVLNCPTEHIRNIRKLKDWQIPNTALSIAFILQNGGRNDNSARWLVAKVKELVLAGRQIADEQHEIKVVKPVRSIQEAMKEKLSDIIGELQGLEDNLTPNVLKWLRSNNIPKIYIDSIEKYYLPRLEEIKSLANTKDEQLKEGYSNYSKKDINRMISWYEELMSDLDAYKRVKQNQRKVRAKKPKSPSKLVSKLKYLSYSEDYKIQSIKPESIVGCSVLWLFNIKTRKLCVYNASEMDKELTVKGTTILGWDPKTSVGKTLRKPNEQLKDFMSGGKVAMRNFHKSIKGKEALLNGRINKDMILLKVY